MLLSRRDRTAGACNQVLQLQRVASVEREFRNALGVDYLAQRAGPRLDLLSLCCDLDALIHRADLQMDVDTAVFIDRYFDAALYELLEARRLGGDGIGADGKLGNDVTAVRLAFRLSGESRFIVGDKNGRLWNSRAARIDNRAEDRDRALSKETS